MCVYAETIYCVFALKDLKTTWYKDMEKIVTIRKHTGIQARYFFTYNIGIYSKTLIVRKPFFYKDEKISA